MDRESFEYLAGLPIMSYIPGPGAIEQNTAGFPAGLSGNVPAASNYLALTGPDAVQLADPTGQPGTGGAELGPGGVDALRGTVGSDFLKKGIFYFLGWTLITIGLVYLLWGPAKRTVETGVKVLT